jgi:hypothetical protein
MYIYIAKSITHTLQENKQTKIDFFLFSFYVREKKIVLHNIAIIDLIWFVHLFCRYKARPLNKSIDHTTRKNNNRQHK